MGLHSANSKVARLDTQMPTLKQRCEDLSDAYRIENQIKLDIHSTRITEILVSLPRALSRIDNTLLEIQRREAEDLRRQETAPEHDTFVSEISFAAFLEKERNVTR